MSSPQASLASGTLLAASVNNQPTNPFDSLPIEVCHFQPLFVVVADICKTSTSFVSIPDIPSV